MGALEDFGDTFVGTVTFGQCNGNGCGADHRGYGDNPIGYIANAGQNVKLKGGVLGQLGLTHEDDDGNIVSDLPSTDDVRDFIADPNNKSIVYLGGAVAALLILDIIL